MVNPDPKGEFFSPYLGMGNNPIGLVDPDGGSVTPPNDYYINSDGTIDIIYTEDNFDRFFIAVNEFSGMENGIGSQLYRFAGQFDKNENGFIALPDFYNFNNFGFQYTGSANENYISGVAFASLLGALNETKFTDVSFNHWSNSDGTSPKPSKSHKNGEVGDLRPLRIDQSGEKVLTSDIQFDKERNAKLISAFKKFGWTSILSEKTNGYITPGTTHYSGYTNKAGKWVNVRHNNHYHIQRFHPKIN